MFAEVWDGSGWKVQAILTPAGTSVSALAAVSCVAAVACTAVGAYQATSGIG